MRSQGRSGLRVVSGIAIGLAAAPSLVAGQAFDHSGWDAAVSKFVTADGVRYADLKRGRVGLDSYVDLLAGVDSAAFDSWSRAERIAYLINAYNSLVVRQVIDNHPIRRRILNLRGLFRPKDSVWQISGFFDGIRHRVAGRDITLDDIEHRWLRDKLDEPRIHFALVCAAVSCPPFRREAYLAERLDEQLDDQARQFFNDPMRNTFDMESGEVRLSAILGWFGDDFERFAPATGFTGDAAQRGSLAFAARFLPAETAAWLRAGDYTVQHLDYDWTLNDVAHRVTRR